LGNLCETDSSRYQYDQFLFIYQSFKVRIYALFFCVGAFGISIQY
jgi:hypothetical protein